MFVLLAFQETLSKRDEERVLTESARRGERTRCFSDALRVASLTQTGRPGFRCGTQKSPLPTGEGVGRRGRSVHPWLCWSRRPGVLTEGRCSPIVSGLEEAVKTPHCPPPTRPASEPRGTISFSLADVALESRTTQDEEPGWSLPVKCHLLPRPRVPGPPGRLAVPSGPREPRKLLAGPFLLGVAGSSPSQRVRRPPGPGAVWESGHGAGRVAALEGDLA